MVRKELTAKQLNVLNLIEKEVHQTGHPPTLRAIAQNLGLKAVGTVQDHIKKLIEYGFLQKEDGHYRGIKLPYQSQVTWVPILGSVPAGKPMEAIQDHRGSLAIKAYGKRDVFALRVSGDSMKDKGILDGDYVIVQNQSDARTGEIVVAVIDQEATVKILDKNKGKITLLPANSAFKPIELHPDRENRILGKVIGVQRLY